MTTSSTSEEIHIACQQLRRDGSRAMKTARQALCRLPRTSS
jgi:hypothetical protein